MENKTHLGINQKLCGTPVEIKENYCKAAMTTTAEMGSDSQGLVHGGFVFGMADYAAMVAVNDPYVVLGASEVQFLKPLKVGDTIIAEATVTEKKGKKRIVSVVVTKDEAAYFKGTFTCFVLENHVLEQ